VAGVNISTMTTSGSLKMWPEICWCVWGMRRVTNGKTALSGNWRDVILEIRVQSFLPILYVKTKRWTGFISPSAF
jgi:hypothetical protein